MCEDLVRPGPEGRRSGWVPELEPPLKEELAYRRQVHEVKKGHTPGHRVAPSNYTSRKLFSIPLTYTKTEHPIPTKNNPFDTIRLVIPLKL